MKKLFLMGLLCLGTLSFATEVENPNPTNPDVSLNEATLFFNNIEFSYTDLKVEMNAEGVNILTINGTEVDLSRDIITVKNLNYTSYSGGTCPGDFDGNGVVGASDFTHLLTNFGRTCDNLIGTACCPDMNGDNVVTAADLVSFLPLFGSSC